MSLSWTEFESLFWRLGYFGLPSLEEGNEFLPRFKMMREFHDFKWSDGISYSVAKYQKVMCR